jgi:hypothetical protein
MSVSCPATDLPCVSGSALRAFRLFWFLSFRDLYYGPSLVVAFCRPGFCCGSSVRWGFSGSVRLCGVDLLFVPGPLGPGLPLRTCLRYGPASGVDFRRTCSSTVGTWLRVLGAGARSSLFGHRWSGSGARLLASLPSSLGHRLRSPVFGHRESVPDTQPVPRAPCPVPRAPCPVPPNRWTLPLALLPPLLLAAGLGPAAPAPAPGLAAALALALALGPLALWLPVFGR